MAFCKNCGTNLPEGATFCSSCGTPVANEAAQAQTQQTAPQPQQYQANTQQAAPQQPVSADADVQNNKFMAVLAYIGILVLIPLFAAKNSKFAQFHARQGLTLAIIEVAYSIVTAIINAILGAVLPPVEKYSLWLGYYTTPNPVASIISAIFGIASIAFLVLAIIGIVNAVKGEEKELPVIGKIDFIKMFTNK